MSIWGTDKITLIGTQELKELRELNAELLAALIGILELGRKDTSNPKYDWYYEEIVRVKAKAEAMK